MSRSRLSSGLAALTLIATILLAKEASGYIRVQNGVFVDEECKEYMFSGYNAWQTIEAALNMCCGNLVGLQNQFQEAARQNFNVVRIFGFPVQKGFNLQTKAGVYNEVAFKGMDIVLSEASKAGIKLIIALTNNWNYNTLQTDWKCSYTNWTTSAHGCDDFFTDRQAIDMYKAHTSKVLNRVNTVTGIPYNQDSTIFGWDLMNEPRSAKDSGIADIQSWITEVAPYVKGLAGHQLVTVGEDGFYGPSTCQAWNGASPFLKNGQDQWPLHTGQDFLPNHMVDGIDFASLHLWPDNWARTDDYFGRKWLDAHLKDQWYLGKPVVIEEFGKAIGMQGGWMAATDQTYSNQYSWFKLVYEYASQSLSSDYGYKGIMFWRWASVDPTANAGGFDEAATISTSSSIFRDIIEPFSQKVNAFLKDRNRKSVPNCKPLWGKGNSTAPAPAPMPDLPIASAPAPAPSTLVAEPPTIPLLNGPVNGPMPAPISAPVNVTPGTLVNAEPGNPIVAAAANPPTATQQLPAKPAATVPIVAPGGVAVVNAPAGGPVKPAAGAAGVVPAVAPAAYVWAGAGGANATAAGTTAGRKLMQTKENVATHASRVADAPLSAAALAPLLAPAESPLSARGPAVEAALAASAPTASAPAPGVAAALPMSSMLSITAPLSATTTVLNDFQEEPMAASVSTTAPRTAAVYNDFQQRNQQGPGQGGPGQGGPGQNGPQQPPQGGPQQPPMPLPGGPFGPFDDSGTSDASAGPAAAPAQSTPSQNTPSQSTPSQPQTIIQPFASSNFKTESTFSTPSNINAYNINYKVTCT